MAKHEVPTLKTAAAAVYGDAWRRALAEAIGVSEHTIRSAAMGRRPLSVDLRARLTSWSDEACVALAERHVESQRAVAELRRVLRSA